MTSEIWTLLLFIFSHRYFHRIDLCKDNQCRDIPMILAIDVRQEMSSTKAITIIAFVWQFLLLAYHWINNERYIGCLSSHDESYAIRYLQISRWAMASLRPNISGWNPVRMNYQSHQAFHKRCAPGLIINPSYQFPDIAKFTWTILSSFFDHICKEIEITFCLRDTIDIHSHGHVHTHSTHTQHTLACARAMLRSFVRVSRATTSQTYLSPPNARCKLNWTEPNWTELNVAARRALDR